MAIAESLLIEVREENLLREVGYHVHSGGCVLKGKELILLDRQVPLAERVDAFVEEIGRRELEGVYISPELRQMLERMRTRRGQTESAEASSFPSQHRVSIVPSPLAGRGSEPTRNISRG